MWASQSAHLIEAIENFPVPTDLTGIRSWFGLVQQVSYEFSKTKEMNPFREFLARNKKLHLASTHDRALLHHEEEDR